jgi:general secretion pathway protein G
MDYKEVIMNSKRKRLRKRRVTLMEMMIVILIIGLVAGVLAYNLKGSLDKGRQFKTNQAQEQIVNILTLEAATRNVALAELVKDWKTVIRESPIVGKSSELIKDGWGQEFTVTVRKEGSDEVLVVKSPHTKAPEKPSS